MNATCQDRLRLLFILFTAILAALYINRSFSDGDEGRYLLLAQSIASGQGQTLIQLPEPVPETLTQPGYPLLLGAGVKLFGLNLSLLKGLSYFGYLLFSFVSFSLIKKLSDSDWVAFLLSIIALWTVSSLGYAWILFSETWYFFFSTVTLYFACTRSRAGARSYIGIALLSALTFSLRPMGLALIGGIFIALFFRKSIKASFTFLGLSAIACSPIAIRSYLLSGHWLGYGEYATQYENLFEKVTAFTHAISLSLPHYLFESLPRALFFALFDQDCLLCKLGLNTAIPAIKITLLLIIFLGFAARCKKFSAVEGYFLLYWLLISASPVHLVQGFEDRYVLPMLLPAAWYLYEGLRLLLGRQKQLFYGSLILLATYNSATAIGAGKIKLQQELERWPLDSFAAERHLTEKASASDRAFARYIEANEWIKASSPAKTVVLSRKPKHSFLISARKGFRLIELKNEGETPLETVRRIAEQHPSFYILEDAFPPDSTYGKDRLATVEPMLKKHKRKFELLHETDEPVTRVWKFKR